MEGRLVVVDAASGDSGTSSRVLLVLLGVELVVPLLVVLLVMPGVELVVLLLVVLLVMPGVELEVVVT